MPMVCWTGHSFTEIPHVRVQASETCATTTLPSAEEGPAGLTPRGHPKPEISSRSSTRS